MANEQTLAGQARTGSEMPRYRCHKEVWALKITHIHFVPDLPGAQLVVEEPGYAPVRVSDDYIKKHEPVIGGYFVVYKDGYQSFSPAEAFEDGYTRCDR
jgi:hypothetical protein